MYPSVKESIKNNCSKDGKCSHCGGCCTEFLILTEDEVKRIKEYVKKNNIKEIRHLNDHEIKVLCPFRDEEKKICTIYEVRPEICKLFQCNQSMDVINKNKELINKKAKYNRKDYKVDILQNMASMHALIFDDYEWEYTFDISYAEELQKYYCYVISKRFMFITMLDYSYFKDEIMDIYIKDYNKKNNK